MLDALVFPDSTDIRVLFLFNIHPAYEATMTVSLGSVPDSLNVITLEDPMNLRLQLQCASKIVIWGWEMYWS